jgi:hypothetical protein
LLVKRGKYAAMWEKQQAEEREKHEALPVA